MNSPRGASFKDFGLRLRLLLEDPSLPWPPIDPEAAVVSRRHQDRDPAESLARFRDARVASIAWLRGLDAPQWDRAKPHPAAGTLHAGELLASWAAHDARHLAADRETPPRPGRTRRRPLVGRLCGVTLRA